jgi:hypothetical protein
MTFKTKALTRTQVFGRTGYCSKALDIQVVGEHANMSRCVVIFHKQVGDLILLEPALRRLAHGNGHTVDLTTRSGFQPIGSLRHARRIASPCIFVRGVLS